MVVKSVKKRFSHFEILQTVLNNPYCYQDNSRISMLEIEMKQYYIRQKYFFRICWFYDDHITKTRALKESYTCESSHDYTRLTMQ